MSVNEKHICRICGKELGCKSFGHMKWEHNISINDYYDKYIKENENEGKCKICGNKTVFDGLNVGYRKYCCSKCKNSDPDVINKNKETLIKKYGVTNASQIPGILEKKKETWVKNYGVDNPSKSKKIIDKIKNINQEKYGVDWSLQSEEVRKKATESTRKKYGVDHNSQSELIKEKKKKTTRLHFGVDNPAQSKEVQDKMKQTMLEKYGVDNISQSEDFKTKKINTSLKNWGTKYPWQSKEGKKLQKDGVKNKYGVDNISQSDETKIKVKKSFYKNWKKKLELIYNDLILNYTFENSIEDMFVYSDKRTAICNKCGKKFSFLTFNKSSVRCMDCYPSYRTDMELEMESFLMELNVKYTALDRKIISPLEIDFYLLDYNVGIEMNGIWWHSEGPEITKYNKDNILENKEFIKNILKEEMGRHHIKYKKAEEKNVKLIQIFEDEWCNKKEIVKSRIRNILHKNNNKIYARKCKIVKISSDICRSFLDENHIQGNDNSGMRYGAFHENELVSVMTFSKPSISKGNKNKDNNIYELSRFAVKIDYTITGMASKFLSFFIKENKPKEIFTYADLRWSNGDLYRTLGFEDVGWTGLNYWYVKNMNRYHRFKYRKRKDEPLDIPEWILRAQEGLYRLWDCGNLKFRLKLGEIKCQ
ncbi:hypothetical protein M0R36_10165 [bacterium]|jgi:hypothetical protein|nr:hypothetical protein [bacterium]